MFRVSGTSTRNAGLCVGMATEYTYRFRVYPNKEQRQHLARTFGCARYVYNWGKELRTNAYHGDGESLSYTDTAKRLTKLKKDEDHEWLQEVSAVVLQQSLRNLEQAFTNFFEGRAEYPSFKRKHGRQAARYVGTAFDLKETEHGRKLRLSKMPGLLKVNWSRAMLETPSSCTLTRDPAGRYHVCFAVKRETRDLPKTKQKDRVRSVGIDLGLTDVIVTSDGWTSGNPRYLQKSERRLRKEQQKLSRKENGPNGPSNNWERQRRRVAKAHAKVADQRRDWTGKLTTKLVREYDLIVCETLAVQNMQKNGCLARAISDVGWGLVVRQLEYKAEWYGKTLVKVDRWFPSTKRCSACGHIGESKPLDVREWTCKECGTVHDRDINAAENLRRVGQTRTRGAKPQNAPGDPGKSSKAFELVGSGR